MCTRTGKSLFLSSEQEEEAANAIDKMWEHYKVLDPEREKHGENLLRCVNDFNSKNF